MIELIIGVNFDRNPQKIEKVIFDACYMQLGIQIQKSKMDLDIGALSLYCRKKTLTTML